MIYFDTDFLIHYFVIQDRKTHLNVKKIFEKVDFNEKVVISLLNLQEVSFVLAKLGMPNFEIDEKLNILHEYSPINYSIDEFKRATEISRKIGFKSINDCIHTAIAENYCQELYTFNQADFRLIKNHTSLKINILTA